MSNDESKNEKINPIKSFFAGGVGGACLVVIGHPPDTIKVRFKKQTKRKSLKISI